MFYRLFLAIAFQVNAGTLLDFFNQLSKTPAPGGHLDAAAIDKVWYDDECDESYDDAMKVIMTTF